MNYFAKKNGEHSRFPIQRKWYYSPAQALLHRLYPDLPEYNSPDQFKDIVTTDWIPLMDIVDRDEDLVIKVELPGVEKEDVSITIHNNELWIQGERRLQSNDKIKFYCCEGNYGTFFRKIRLSDYPEKQGIKSELKNGILTITLSKNKKEKPKSIPIE